MGLLFMFRKFSHNNIIKYSDKYKASKENIPLYYSKEKKNMTVSFYKVSQIMKKRRSCDATQSISKSFSVYDFQCF